MNQTVDRALELLVFLQSGPQSLDQCADRIGVHKSTVLRLLQTLEAQRFVTHNAQHRYRLGSRFFEISAAALEQRDMRGIVHPHLESLSARISQTVHLAVYESGKAVYIDKIESHTGIRMYSRIGLVAALHATAVGKVLVADLPPAKRRLVAESIDYVKFTDRTISGPDEYLVELERVRADGFARDSGEHETFINCIGAPIRDASGSVVAAVSISVPTVSLPADEVIGLLPALLETAEAASDDLGWSGWGHTNSGPHS